MSPRLTSLAEKRIVVLPDLYIDVLVPGASWSTTRQRLDSIAARGGGNLPVGAMTFKVGGNAANLALALARLGAQVDLVARTNPMGLDLLRSAAADSPLSTRHVQVSDTSASTVALECGDANVMLSHAGPVAEFGVEALDEDARRTLRHADAVAVVNWAQNARGTELLATVAEELADSPAFLFVDTADPRHREPAAVAELLQAREAWQRVDAWGLNENELGAFRPEAADMMEGAIALSRALDVRLDIHTREWAATVRGAPGPQVAAEAPPGRRKTGAGDAWNAGNIAGEMLEWSDAERLRLAHQVATRYVTSEDGMPPLAHELAVPALRHD